MLPRPCPPYIATTIHKNLSTEVLNVDLSQGASELREVKDFQKKTSRIPFILCLIFALEILHFEGGAAFTLPFV